MPDAGSITVLGLDPQRNRAEIRECVGVQPQACSLPWQIKVWEVVGLVASFYARPTDPAELISELGLAEKSNEFCGRLSGGQKQRVSIALALVAIP